MKKTVLLFTAILIFSVLVCVFTACDNNGYNSDDDNSLKIGEITQIELGKTAQNLQYGLSLQFEKVIEDSRCPANVQCVWEGNASVQLHLTTPTGMYDFSLDTHPLDRFKNDTVIENIRYQLIDVLPYPVFGENPQQEPTVIILVGGCSLAGSQWKLVQIANKTTQRVNNYPQDNEPYIIYFKKDFIVEFPLNCNISQGSYRIENDGTITFDNFFPRTKRYCQGLSEWEMMVTDNLLKSGKYKITGNLLTIDCEENRLIFVVVDTPRL